MAWEVEHTDEFEAWWDGLADAEHIQITAILADKLYAVHLESLAKEGLIK